MPVGVLVEQGTHADLMKLQGVYYDLVKTQDEGQVESTEEKDKAEAEQNNNNNNDVGIILEEEPTPGINDELRKSFLVPTSKMRTMSNKDKSSRSEARLSRYGVFVHLLFKSRHE